MGLESEDKWREPFLKAGAAMTILGGVLMAIASADTWIDVLPGDNPFSGEGHGSLRHVLRQLKDMPPQGMSWDVMSVPQKITSAGFTVTGANALFFHSWKLQKVTNSWTLAALAGYEVVKFFTTGHVSLSRLVFFLGATISLGGAGLISVVSKPKPLSEQAKEGVQKAKSLLDRFRGRK